MGLSLSGCKDSEKMQVKMVVVFINRKSYGYFCISLKALDFGIIETHKSSNHKPLIIRRNVSKETKYFKKKKKKRETKQKKHKKSSVWVHHWVLLKHTTLSTLLYPVPHYVLLVYIWMSLFNFKNTVRTSINTEALRSH